MGPIIPKGSKIPAKSRNVFRLVAGKSFARLAITVSSRVIVSSSKSHDRPSTFWPLLPIFRPRDNFAYVTFSTDTGLRFTSSIRSFFILSLTLASLVSHFLSLNPPSAMRLTVLLYKSATSLDEAPPPTKSST